MLYGPAEPTSLVFLNRVLDRRHNEAAPAWTLHLVLHVPLLYGPSLSKLRLRLCTIALLSGPSLSHSDRGQSAAARLIML